MEGGLLTTGPNTCYGDFGACIKAYRVTTMAGFFLMNNKYSHSPSMLHTDPGEAVAIVTTLVPVGVGHEDTSLHITQGNG